jgi:calcineurin-like phosphoesterase family protein
MKKFYIVSDWHLNHQNIKTYCQRPDDFTDLIFKRHNHTVTDNDTVIMLGDVAIGKKALAVELIRQLKGRLILVRGNHDRDKSCGWWMENGFAFACDSFTFRNVLFTHEPAEPEEKIITNGQWKNADVEKICPMGREFNIHGHLHNIWSGFHNPERIERDKELLGANFMIRLKHPWQRLFALEYTNYTPVEFQNFLVHPEKYQATGPTKKLV